MAKPKAEVPVFTIKTNAELEATVVWMKETKEKLKKAEAAYKLREAAVVKYLGPKAIFQFEAASLVLRATVVSAMRRSVPWKDIALDFAKRLYPTRDKFIVWARAIVKKYPKKPTASWVKITATDEVEEIINVA